MGSARPHPTRRRPDHARAQGLDGGPCRRVPLPARWLGTLEEIFEVWTWRTLGYHDKTVGFLDTGAFRQTMLEVFRAMVANDFVHEATLKDIVVEHTMDAAVAGLAERV